MAISKRMKMLVQDVIRQTRIHEQNKDQDILGKKMLASRRNLEDEIEKLEQNQKPMNAIERDKQERQKRFDYYNSLSEEERKHNPWLEYERRKCEYLLTHSHLPQDVAERIADEVGI